MEGWGFVIIGGPVLFAAVLIWAMLHNRTSKAQLRRTEEATRRTHEEQKREDMARDEA
jgi:hypothetical protein